MNEGPYFGCIWSYNSMFLLNLVAICILITVGIFLISYLEEKFVSGPRRRELQRKAKEKLNRKEPADQDQQ